MFELFYTFFKIGMFTFGGGLAMIPIIEKEMIENKKWINRDEMLEMITISQITPGPIAINTATFIGRKRLGFKGAVCATIGVVLPSLILLTLISIYLSKSFTNPIIQKGFLGLRSGIVALILSSIFSLSKTTFIKMQDYIIFIISLGSLIFFNFSPIILIVGFGVFSIIFNLKNNN